MNCKNKSFMAKRKAFTLIELLIVIAIIGILFIVLVSKVDFATDKAKATGVQTDFRSFQVAIESVAKENAGLATFGWDTGDTNGNRIRDSYDKGDINKNGKQDDGEVFVGSKTYGEEWTNIYTLTNPADTNDKSAIAALEAAINANLDPKLHIRINDDLTITMANGAQDPWNTEYHGCYITNATVDKKDNGAIVIYSNGANQEFGSEHSISNGVVVVNVPGNNVYGKDDYSIASVYTYANGYGEVKTTTTGFSNNQGGGQAGTDGTFAPGNGDSGETPDDDVMTGNIIPDGGTYYVGAIGENASSGMYSSYDVDVIYYAGDYFPEPQIGDAFVYGDYIYVYRIYGEEFNGSVWFDWTNNIIDGNSWGVGIYDRDKTSYGKIESYINDYPVTHIDELFFAARQVVTPPSVPSTVTSMWEAYCAYYGCAMTSIVIEEGVTQISEYFAQSQQYVTDVYLPSTLKHIGSYAFSYLSSGVTFHFNGTKEEWGKIIKNGWTSDNYDISIICIDGVVCGQCNLIIDENTPWESLNNSVHGQKGKCSICNTIEYNYEWHYTYETGEIIQNPDNESQHLTIIACSKCEYVDAYRYEHWFAEPVDNEVIPVSENQHKRLGQCECGKIDYNYTYHNYEPIPGEPSIADDSYSHHTKSKCIDCNYIGEAYYSHSGGEANCTYLARCEDCNEPYGSLGSHFLDGATCTICHVEGVLIESEHYPYQNSQNYVVLGNWDFSDAKSVTIILTYQLASSDHFSVTNGTDVVSGSTGYRQYLQQYGTGYAYGNDSKVKFRSTTLTTRTFSNLNFLTGTVILNSDSVSEDYYGVSVVVIPNY